MHLSKAGFLIAALAAAGYATSRVVHPGATHPAAIVVDPPHAVAVASERERATPRATAAPPRTTVFIAGAVRRPGVYALPSGSRIVDAYRAAGGTAPRAEPVAVDRAATVRDGEEIVVPRLGERAVATTTDADPPAIEESTASTIAGDDAAPKKRHRRKRRKKRRHEHVASATAGDPSASATTATSPAVVDVNAADADELQTLPGIGPALADRIVRYRELNGRFASPGELADVAGMTAGKIDAIEPLARFR